MSLFLKIFLWFWGAMAITGLSLLALQETMQEDLVVPPRRGLMLESLAGYGREAVRAYETGGEDALQAYLRTIEERTRVRVFLFAPDGRQLVSDERAPSDVVELARKTSYGFEPQFELSAARVMAAQPVISPRGTYVFAGAVSRSLLAATRHQAQTNWLRLLTALAVIGVFCYGLARYLAAPVGKIRRAAQRIAAGDLSARVEPNRIPRGHDEIAELASDFDQMAERLEHLVTAQTRLLGDVSHELRSPLARLNLALELARRGDATRRSEALARIERESARLDELIGELLTLSRLESGLTITESARVDLAQLGDAIAADADFEARGTGRGVGVIYEGPEFGAIVRGDEELLRRAIENVTRNAIRHTAPDSSVCIEVEAARSRARVRVLDSGPGVPESELASIFRPFYRVEGARERDDGARGTGLGLSIAERAVSAHGGSIRAANRPEGGLAIEIELPGATPESRRAHSLNAARE